LNPVKRQ